ncbi:MAG: hypothetical protein K0Q49_1135 [Haloplasmataceae bacterium]|jgi:hypothetical protein|nr:hypothetical protein [Haloplasmataceae bacterium]
MKKRIFFFISLLFIFLCINSQSLSAKTFDDQIIYEKYAKIISANYINSELLIKLEIDEKVYNGKFSEDLSYEDYLFFHHNEGIVINISYYVKNNQLIIIKWFA